MELKYFERIIGFNVEKNDIPEKTFTKTNIELNLKSKHKNIKELKHLWSNTTKKKLRIGSN